MIVVHFQARVEQVQEVLDVYNVGMLIILREKLCMSYFAKRKNS